MGSADHGLRFNSLPELRRRTGKFVLIKDLWLPGLDSK